VSRRGSDKRRRPSTFETTLFRYVPAHSVVHRLSATTKLVALLVFATALGLEASWSTIAYSAVVLAAVLALSRLPLSVLRVLPGRLVFLLVGADLFFSLLSHKGPRVHVGHVAVAVGGVASAAKFLLLSFEYLVLVGLVGWTTPPAEVAASLSRVLRPLRRLRFPVEEFVTTLALAVRTMPLILVELRMMLVARRLKGFGWSRVRSAQRLKEVVAELTDFVLGVVGTSIARAEEMATAMAMRGGYSSVVGVAAREEKADWVAYLALFLATGVLVYLGVEFS
jgi:energy-coupling factor transporter transmembrane protein EcfT